MKIRYSTDKSSSLYHETLSQLSIDEDDTTTLSTNTFIRKANIWYRMVDSWIWQATGTWEFDDSDFSTLPIATTTLVNEQQNYEIPSTARKIDRVTILDSDEDEQLLIPRDKSQFGVAPAEHYETAGLPREYDMVGRSIFLYPKPDSGDVTLASGLKLYVSRDIDEFTTSDTTKEPGFDNHFHPLISYGVALDWGGSHGLSTREINRIKGQINELKNDLKEFVGFKHRDMKPKIRRKKENLI